MIVGRYVPYLYRAAMPPYWSSGARASSSNQAVCFPFFFFFFLSTLPRPVVGRPFSCSYQRFSGLPAYLPRYIPMYIEFSPIHPPSFSPALPTHTSHTATSFLFPSSPVISLACHCLSLSFL